LCHDNSANDAKWASILQIILQLGKGGSWDLLLGGLQEVIGKQAFQWKVIREFVGGKGA